MFRAGSFGASDEGLGCYMRAGAGVVFLYTSAGVSPNLGINEKVT